MRGLPNIDKSGFKRGQYVGYADGVWTIVKSGGGWRAQHRENKHPAIRGATLEEVSAQLAQVPAGARRNNPRNRRAYSGKHAELAHVKITDGEVPNLDAMPQAELWDFGMRYGHFGTPITAREMFPKRPSGYVKIARFVGHYATNKAVAMKARAGGDIPAALVYEKIADNIYDELPEWARW